MSMKKGRSGTLPCGKRAPIGQLAIRVPVRRPLRATDVNVSSVFRNQQGRVREKPRSSPLLRATAMGGALENTTTSRVGTRRVRPRRIRGGKSRDGNLGAALSEALSLLHTRLRVLGGELDKLVAFHRLVRLSEHELLVVASPRLLVLHSGTPLTQETVDRFGAMKLALNSQCYYVLYNDVEWYMRWKFF